jgi:hypothetical protein
MRRVAVCALVSLLAWGLTSFGAPSEAHAGGSVDAITVQVTGAPLSNITSSPLSLSPSFAPTITDYVWRCGSGINTLQITLTAVSGGTITVAGRGGNTVTVQESLIENQAVIINVPDPNATKPPAQYWIRCLPHDFPALTVTKPLTPPSGWYLTGTVNPGPAGGSYAMVLDANGTPVWYRDPAGSQAINVTSLGDGTIAWIGDAGPGIPAFEDYDLATEATGWLAAPILPTDLHEIYRLPNGHLMMLSNPWRNNVDMTAFGGDSNANIVDCVLQEVDSAHQPIWQWRASDHLSVGESIHANSFVAFGYVVYDPFHCNSIDTDPMSGSVLLSARHTDAVYLIDKTSGAIIWKLGGTAVSESGSQRLAIVGDPDGAFHAQHDARFQPNGDISLYDNQTWDTNVAARGVEYHVDTAAGAATLVWSFQAPDGHNSAATGSFRRLSGGTDNVIGWGFKPGTLFTEVDATGRVMLDVSFPNGEEAYRVQKVGPAALDHNLLRATAGLPSFSFTPDTDPVITASGTTLTAIEDTGFTNTVATFVDPDPAASASEFLATIAWGDGSSSAGTISGPTGGPFSISGTHTYASAATDVAAVYISDVDAKTGSSTRVTSSVASTVRVADAAISATCTTPAVSLSSFGATVATFTDADPSGSASQHRATIAWGDASSSPGVVSGPDGGPFTVSATHTYGSTGRFNITTTINDVAGSSSSASCNALIYAFPSGAVALAIGERNTTNGSTITYRVVPLSSLDSWGGEEPSSWKELWPKLAPSCGIDWGIITGKGGPTVRRPLPDYMGVIVISRAIESASRSTGITAHIVVVRTNTRRPDRGTVEAQIC